MALIFLEYPLFLTFSISSFIKSNCCNFIANDEWSLIHPITVQWIIRLRASNTGPISQYQYFGIGKKLIPVYRY